MREHMGLYRGKRIDNGEWVEGFYIAHLNACHYIVPCSTGGYEAMDDSFYVHKWYEVDPTTIGECTSLRDKNGKLIFEGDIVKDHNGVVYPVVFDLTGYYLKYAPLHSHGFHYDLLPLSNYWHAHGAVIEIIGNIHDNPELLKGGEQ